MADILPWRNHAEPASDGPLDGDGGGGDNGDMEARLAKLETAVEKLDETLNAIRIDMAVMKSNYATKADVTSTKTDIANTKTSIIMWVVGTIFFAQVLPALPGILRAFGWIQ